MAKCESCKHRYDPPLAEHPTIPCSWYVNPPEGDCPRYEEGPGREPPDLDYHRLPAGIRNYQQSGGRGGKRFSISSNRDLVPRRIS